MNYYQLFSKIYEKEAERMCRVCQGFIEKKVKILDLGCGSGIITEGLKNFFEAEILGVDIEDKRIKNIPFQIINGKDLPFKENEFDVVFISYVLHHTENPKRILEEAERVAKTKIIIFEDLFQNLPSKILGFFHLFSFNLFFQKKNQKVLLKENLTENIKKMENLEEIFKKSGLKIVFKKILPPRLLNWLYPIKKIMYVLEKNLI